MNFEVHLNEEGGIGPLPSENHEATEEFAATTYIVSYPERTKGVEMIGHSCTSCMSTLVKRINKLDSRHFIACDKSKRAFCSFTIGMYETMGERTRRINHKLSNRKR